MLLAQYIVAGILALVAVGWMLALYRSLKIADRQPALHPLDAGLDFPAADASLVSIILAARDEEGRFLYRAIRSILAQDYPRFELLAVDDRSSDGTPGILQEFAAQDKRLRVIQGRPLPPGWRGKPHALQQAQAQARGEWILALDADVFLHPSAVTTALHWAHRHQYDVVTVSPRIECRSFWDRVMNPCPLFILRVVSPMEEINDPRWPRACIWGGFVLMRRAALAAIGGYASVKGEVTEDVALAVRFKRLGYRLFAAEGPRLVCTAFRDLADIWESYRKHSAARARPHPRRVLIEAGVSLLFTVVPPAIVFLSALSLLSGQPYLSFWVQMPAWIAYGGLVSVHWYLLRPEDDIPRWSAFLVFLGYLMFIAILLNSTWRVKTKRGITWRGRPLYQDGTIAPP